MLEVVKPIIRNSWKWLLEMYVDHIDSAHYRQTILRNERSKDKKWGEEMREGGLLLLGDKITI